MAGPAYVDPTARMFGNVNLGDGSSLWPYAVVRCERRHVSIGMCTSVQDHAMVHIGWDFDTVIGDYCTVGHRAVVHGCTIEPACLISVGATIMEGCIVGYGSVIAGHAFLPPHSIIPPHSLVMGTPGRVVRRADKLRSNVMDALLYRDNGRAYAAGDHRAWEDAELDALGLEADGILSSEHDSWRRLSLAAPEEGLT
jgi:carbonic anhydrase/acetyltransferase-like protein (isoleucine patch superfamily)